MNTANLLKLAEYLEALPADYRHFDMELFIKSGTEFRPTYPAKAEETIKHCGTAACAIGHGPSAGILPPSIPAMNNWGVYCEEAFGMNFMDNEGQWCLVRARQYTSRRSRTHQVPACGQTNSAGLRRAAER
jgi:hypothetical protein